MITSSRKVALEGYAQINRKKYWVLRYIQVFEDGLIQYTKKKEDPIVRAAYALKELNIKQALDDQKQKLIVLNTITKKPETIKIMLDNTRDHHIWLKKILQIQQDTANSGRNVPFSEVGSNPDETDCGASQIGFPNQANSSMSGFLRLTKQSKSQGALGNSQFGKKQQILVQEDNESNINLIDSSFFSKLSEQELVSTKAKTNTFLSYFDQSQFVVADNRQDLQILAHKNSFPFNEQPKPAQSLLSPISQAILGVKQKSLPLFLLALIILISIIATSVHLLLEKFGVVPASLGILVVLNLALIPLFSSGKPTGNSKKTVKLMGKYLTEHNANEIMFSLTNVEQRSKFQPNAVLSENKGHGFTIHYVDGTVENVIQYIYKDENQIYILETNSDNSDQAIRLFQLKFNEDRENCEINFYGENPAIYGYNGQNSPSILLGIDYFLKTQKMNPESLLSEYYKKLVASINNGNPSLIKSPQKMTKSLIEESEEQIQPTQVIKEEEEIQAEKQINQPPNPVEEQKVELPPQQEAPAEAAPAAAVEGEEAGIFKNDEHKKAFELLEPKYKQFNQLINLDASWKKLEDKNGLKVHTKSDSQTGLTMSRGETTINVPIQPLIEYIGQIEKKGEYDEMFREGRKVEEYSNRVSVSYQRLKGKAGVADRDFCFANASFYEGKYVYLVGSSVTHPNVPEVKGAVRGHIIIGGWKLEEVGPREVKAIYVTQADPNGKIPDFIKNWAAKLQGYSVKKIREVVEKKGF